MSERIVYVVDDDEAVRESLQALLESAGYSVETFGTGTEAINKHDKALGGCVLLDLHLPDVDGLEVLRRLRADGGQLPVIMITGDGDVPTAVTAMKEGAFGFFLKPADDEELIGQIEAALRLDEEERRKSDSLDEVHARLQRLTPREHEVLEHLIRGEPNKVIAIELDISPRTVEIHRAKVMEKMEAAGLADVVRMAIAAGLDR